MTPKPEPGSPLPPWRPAVRRAAPCPPASSPAPCKTRRPLSALAPAARGRPAGARRRRTAACGPEQADCQIVKTAAWTASVRHIHSVWPENSSNLVDSTGGGRRGQLPAQRKQQPAPDTAARACISTHTKRKQATRTSNQAAGSRGQREEGAVAGQRNVGCARHAHCRAASSRPQRPSATERWRRGERRLARWERRWSHARREGFGAAWCRRCVVVG